MHSMESLNEFVFVLPAGLYKYLAGDLYVGKPKHQIDKLAIRFEERGRLEVSADAVNIKTVEEFDDKPLNSHTFFYDFTSKPLTNLNVTELSYEQFINSFEIKYYYDYFKNFDFKDYIKYGDLSESHNVDIKQEYCLICMCGSLHRCSTIPINLATLIKILFNDISHFKILHDLRTLYHKYTLDLNTLRNDVINFDRYKSKNINAKFEKFSTKRLSEFVELVRKRKYKKINTYRNASEEGKRTIKNMKFEHDNIYNLLKQDEEKYLFVDGRKATKENEKDYKINSKIADIKAKVKFDIPVKTSNPCKTKLLLKKKQFMDNKYAMIMQTNVIKNDYNENIQSIVKLNKLTINEHVLYKFLIDKPLIASSSAFISS